MILYFGRDKNGRFADHEIHGRNYISEEMWHALVKAGAHVGADISTAHLVGGKPARLKVTEQVTVEKYEDDKLVERIELDPETTYL